MHEKIIFYTYFIGSIGNDSIRWHIKDLPSKKYQGFYYTNNPRIYAALASSDWTAVWVDKPFTEDPIDNCMYGKQYKLFPDKLPELAGYSYVCFVDSKVPKISESWLEGMIQYFMVEQNYALLLRQHPFIPPSVCEEYNESMKQPRYQIERENYLTYIQHQLDKGLRSETEYHCACGLLIRNMAHEKTSRINKLWDKHIQECGIQDQISFFFVKQYFEAVIFAFADSPFSTGTYLR